MKLYEVEAAIMECVDMETGEILDEERLEELNLVRDKLIENLMCWVKNMKSDVEQLKAEEKSLAERRHSIENKLKSVSGYLERTLDGVKFATPKGQISWRKTASVIVEDVYKIPEEYLRYKEPEADKTALKKAIQAGENIEGAYIMEGKSMSIK